MSGGTRACDRYHGRMRFLALLVLTLLPALAQGTPVCLQVRVGAGMAGTTVDLYSEAKFKERISPLLVEAGYRLVEAAEAEAAPEGLVLTVRCTEFQREPGLRGYDLSLQLSRADLTRDHQPDPKALSVVGSKLGRAAQVPEGAAWQEVAPLLTRLLKAKAAPTPSPRPALPSGVPMGVPGGVVGGVVGGTGRVVDFDFSQLKVKYQPPVPPYPVLARAARIQGLVVLEMVIDPEGVPVEVSCHEGPAMLRTFAEAYALDWRFEPAKINGVPQWAKFKLMMPFKLTE